MRSGRYAPRLRPTSLAISLGAAVLLAAFATTTALACPVCMPPARATVAGPGLSGTISIGDTTALAGIAVTTLPGFDARVPIAEPAKPANLGQGYEVARYYQPIGGQTAAPNPAPLAYDHFLYFPASPGSPAVYLYEGPVAQNSQVMIQIPSLDAMAGKWYAANQTEIAALQALLAATRAPHRVVAATPALPTRAQSPRRTTPAWWQQTNWLLVALIMAGFALLAGALVVLRRQSMRALPVPEPQQEREQTPAHP